MALLVLLVSGIPLSPRLADMVSKMLQRTFFAGTTSPGMDGCSRGRLVPLAFFSKYPPVSLAFYLKITIFVDNKILGKG